MKTKIKIPFLQEIKIPVNVEIIKESNYLKIKGPLGSTKFSLKNLDKKGISDITVKLSLMDNVNKISRYILSSHSKLFSRTFCSILKQKIEGVTRGFLINLRIVGIGNKATLENQTLTFKLGFSHDIKYQVSNSLRVFLLEPTLICLYGIEKNQITETAAKIKNLKLPESYKGKGVRLSEEIILLKQGKRK